MLISIAVLLSVSRNHFVCYCWVWRCGDGRGGRGGAGEAASLMSIFCRGLRTLGCAEPHGFVSSLSVCIYSVYLLCVSKLISGHCIVSERTEGGAAQHLIKISSEREWQQEVQEAEEEVAGWCQVWRTGDRSATMAGGAEAHPSSSGGSGHCHSPLFTDSHLQSVQSMQRLCGGVLGRLI